MAFAKGNKLGQGRPAGKPNKTSVAAKEALQLAFDGMGGVPALTAWAMEEKNQGEFYKIYAKLLPMELKGSLDVVSKVIQVELPKKNPK